MGLLYVSTPILADGANIRQLKNLFFSFCLLFLEFIRFFFFFFFFFFYI